MPDLHGHLAKRDNLVDFFQPKSTVQYHFSDSDDSPDYTTYTLEHFHATYVNLETIEPLLHSQSEWCARPHDVNHSQIIKLPFVDASHFFAAREAWQSWETLLFVVEHDSCFEGRHERSVYGLNEPISFDETSYQVTLNAKPRSANVLTPLSKWASELTYQTALKPEGTILERRGLRRRGLGSFFKKVGDIIRKLGDLGKGIVKFFETGEIDWKHTHKFNMEMPKKHKILGRSSNFGDWNTLAGIPTLTCLDCHTRGEIYLRVYFHISLDEVTEDEVRAAASGALKCLQGDDGRHYCQQQPKRSTQDVVATLDAHLERERAARRSWSHIQRRDWEIWEDIERYTKGKWNKLEECLEGDFSDCVKKIPEHLGRVFGLDGDGDGDILDFDGLFTSLVSKHLVDAYARFEVREAVDINLQLEFATELAIELSAGLDIYPAPAPVIIPSFSWTFSHDSLKHKYNLDAEAVKEGRWKDLIAEWNPMDPKWKSSDNPDGKKYEGPKVGGANSELNEEGMFKGYQKAGWTVEGAGKDRKVVWHKKGTGLSRPTMYTGSDKPATKNGFGIFPIEAVPIYIGAALGVKGTFIARLPGVSVQIPKGQYWHFDLKNVDHVKSNLTPNITFLKPDFEFENPEVYLNIMTGPKASFGLAHNFMKGLPKNLNPTLSFQVRADVARLDNSIFEKVGDFDGQCVPDSDDKKSKPSSAGAEAIKSTSTAQSTSTASSEDMPATATGNGKTVTVNPVDTTLRSSVRPSVTNTHRSDPSASGFIPCFDENGRQTATVDDPAACETNIGNPIVYEDTATVTSGDRYTVTDTGLESDSMVPDVIVCQDHNGIPTKTVDNEAACKTRDARDIDLDRWSGSNSTSLHPRKDEGKSWGFRTIFRTGGVASAQILQLTLDTGSLGKVDKKPEGTSGLYWSKQLFGVCRKCNGDCLSDKVNGFTDKIFERITEKVNEVILDATEGMFSPVEDKDKDKQLIEAADKNKAELDKEYNNALGVEYTPGQAIGAYQVN